ncbi:MAG: DUF3048 domain-containing protein [Clostridia bacterium]|nr:DUF3048 domain-containing protein [Clostridia bacterium]
MKRKIILLMLLAAITVNTVSCDVINSFIYPQTTETETEETEAEVTETQQIIKPAFTDPLTGEPSDKDYTYSRPVAVVVKNDRKASPQYGLSKAAVLYEALVEGGITRFLAVYSDVSLVSKVGPVIDSRTYFYDFAANHNAVFVQAGTTASGNKAQVSRGITALDAIVGDMTPGFYRDELLNKARGFENSVVTDASGLKARASQYGVSLSVSARTSPYEITDYLLNREMNNGKYCTYLSIPFSTNATVEYSYSTLTNKYTRSQYGEPHTDAETGKPLSFTNLILLIADYNTIDQSTGEMEVVNNGSGSGYYVYGGSSVMIKWQRTDGTNPIRLYETDGLTPLKIAAGNTYVAVVSPRLSGKIEFEKAENK